MAKIWIQGRSAYFAAVDMLKEIEMKKGRTFGGSLIFIFLFINALARASDLKTTPPTDKEPP